MKIGIPTFYEYDNLEDNLKFLKEVNASFIELNLNFPYIKKAIYQDTEETLKLLNKYGCENTIHFYDEGDFASLEVASVYIELFKKCVDKAKILNTKNINIHLNLGGVVTINGIKNYIYEKEYEDFYKRLYDNLSIINNYCENKGINLVIENVSGNSFIKETLKRLDKKFMFTYDIGHDYMSKSFLKDFYFNTKNIKEFHIHDSDGNKDHLELGKGLINLDEYLNIAKDKYCLIEVKETKSYINSINYLKNIKSTK